MVNAKILLGIDIEYWALVISFLAIIIALLKDFLLPFLLKPKIVIDYIDEEPFRRNRIVPRDPMGQIKESDLKNFSTPFYEDYKTTQECVTHSGDPSIGSLPPNYVSLERGNKHSKGPKRSSYMYIDCCFLRLSVKNRGRRPAINCRCQIVDVKSSTGQKLDYAGFTLRWACRPESRLDPIKGERLNIGVGETEFLDFAMARKDDERIILLKYHGEFVGLCDTIEPGDYLISLIFSGDNFKPRTMEFRLTKNRNKEIDEIKLSKVKKKSTSDNK